MKPLHLDLDRTKKNSFFKNSNCNDVNEILGHLEKLENKVNELVHLINEQKETK